MASPKKKEKGKRRPGPPARPTAGAVSRADAKVATRDALIDAATASFLEDGLDGASLDDLCARAGKTRGAFYVHFADREALMVAALEKVLHGFVDAMLPLMADVETAIAVFSHAVDASSPVVAGGKGGRFHQVLAACSRYPAVGRAYREVLERAKDGLTASLLAGRKEGTVRDDVPASHLADALVSLALGTLAAFDVGLRPSGAHLASAARALVFSGPPSGRHVSSGPPSGRHARIA